MQNCSSRFVFPFAPAAARLTDGMALFVILVSLLAITGWIFGIAELKGIWPNPAAIQPVVAAGLLLSGTALRLLHRTGRNPNRQMLGQIFSAIVAVLGGLVLLEYLGDVSPDQWLFPDTVAEKSAPHSGSPSPSAAYCLFLAGMALVALDAEAGWIAPFLALQILLFALLALVGHACYEVSALYQTRPYVSIPLHAAVSLFGLGIGILSARPKRYLTWLISPFAGSVMARNLLPAAVLLPFAIGLIQLKGQHSGLYSADFGWALFITFHIVAFSGMIYLAAKLLNKADSERETGFAALQEGEERFRLLFQASPNGLLMADLEGKVRLANRQSEALFGYQPGQLQGRALETLLKDPAQDHPYAYREPFTVKLLFKIKGIGSEMIGLRRDGTQFTAQVDGSSLVTREGNMLLVTLVDVTRRKLAEAERDRFVALAEGSTEFIGMCDRNFKPFYVNPAGMRMMGLEDLTAACSVRVQDYYFPEDRAHVSDEFFPRVMREGNAEVEIRFRHFQTGKAIWMLCNVFNLRDEKGRISGWATVGRNIHRRKLTEEALEQQQILLLSIMQATDVMLVYLDPRFHFIWVNASYADTCGMKPEELLGKNHFDLYPDPENETIFRQVRDTGKAVFYKDKPFVFPDQPERGTTYWDWSLVPATDLDESVTGLVLSLRETTPFKLAQEALRESEERFRKLVESYAQAVWEAGADGVVAVDSPSWRAYTGQTFEEWIGYGWLDAVHPEDRDYAARQWHEAVATRHDINAEFRIKSRNDGWRWTNVRATPLLSDNGQVIKWVGSNTDIHDWKQAEEALRESEERLRLAWKATRDVIWDWDIMHDLQRWSEASMDVFGWRDAVDAPQTARWGLERVHPDDQQRVAASVRVVLDNPAVDHWEYEYRFLRSDGHYACVLDRGFVLRDNRGKPCRMIGAMQDITERKRAEEKMQELNQMLERQVKLRTRELETINARIKNELAERQLAESRAVASLREKEVLLKEIHHRVKNNLQVIASLLRLQAASLTDPAARCAFLDSQQRVHSMALAHEHLYQSRSLARIKMAEYITSLVNSLRRSYGQAASSIQLKIQIADVELDVEQTVPIGLIISELVSNSFKYAFTPPPANPSGALWIKLANDKPDRLILEVGDNGRGIPDDVEITKPLSMGLHLVQSFVLQLNGQLTVRRRPETVFSISIPKKKGNHA
ncbi:MULTISPECIES: PAS domain S-box protein [Methylomicrobium]|uniref:PAS domain S-box n=1 Tax=Methylomicrobium album BG8 TaxID=686340 RepID=H8GML2_METAL|nr:MULTISPECIES: PAS domain S-box protein [Methylomicrobium]EIC28252.1 PAS domain S-box [Methylomicrobium album BG8]